MLINFDTLDAGQVNGLTGVHHRHSQIGTFTVIHILEEDRHGQRTDLIVGNFAVGVTFDNEINLFCCQFLAVTLLLD
ncbi:hypothetical protein D3C85_1370060 [compost metagenome]